MKLILQRTHAVGSITFGKLFADGAFFCYTLEDEVREVRGQPVASWKIRGQTAMPSTEFMCRDYRISLENSPRFGIDTLTINDVPGFVGVRIHAGNTAADTEGCPLLGMVINDGGIVGGTSGPAVKLVKAAVKQAIGRGELVTLTITNAVELA